MDDKDLTYYRAEIAKLDDIIIDALVQRFELTDMVGKYKKSNGIPIHNAQVEEEIYARLTKKAGGKIDSILIQDIYGLIIYESKKRQNSL